MMKVAVMGAGAMGGYFGARLSAAGHDVTLIARGAHLEALQKYGLRLISPKGDLHLPEIRAVATPEEAGAADVVLFMVKNHDVPAAGEAIRPIVGPETMVVTCQNGVSAPDRLAEVIGWDAVVPGVARMPGDIAEPGVIRHSASFDSLAFGEISGGQSMRTEKLHDALIGANVMAELPGHILHNLWTKFIMQATYASMSSLTRLDLGPLRQNPDSFALLRAAMEEALAVARAAVPDLPDNVIDAGWDHLKNVLPADSHASMLDDLTRGKPIENAFLSGDVVRIGRKHGVPTPIHETFARALAPYEAGSPV